MTDQNSQFFAILTAVGEAKQANANALGVPWTFAQMGVGDANNTDPVPSRTQTRLINERRRAPLNQLTIDPKDSSVIIAEQVIPPDVGGWWIREIGLYDTAGDLVAVANCAPSYKPLLAQGTGKTQVVRLNLVVTSSANVQLKIDPAVVLATRDYVDSKILTVLPPNKTAGTYTMVDVNERGIVQRGYKPTTLAEYGITDAMPKNGGGLLSQQSPIQGRLDAVRETRFVATGPSTEDGPPGVNYAIGAHIAWGNGEQGIDILGALNGSDEFYLRHFYAGSTTAHYRVWTTKNFNPSTKADKAQSLAGYGITDAYNKTDTKYLIDQAVVPLASKATTLAGYGITDAMPKGAGGLMSTPPQIVGPLAALVTSQFVSTSEQTTDRPVNVPYGTGLHLKYPDSNYSLELLGGVVNEWLGFRRIDDQGNGVWRGLWHEGNFKPGSKADKATTLSGYGITDGLSNKGGVVDGNLTFLSARNLYMRAGQTQSFASGLVALSDTDVTQAGVGFYGSQAAGFTKAYLAMGPTPWANGTGVRVDANGVEITGPANFQGVISGNGSGIHSLVMATQAEAESGTDMGRPMSSLRVFQAINKVVKQATSSLAGILRVATQNEVDTGTGGDIAVTPSALRWKFAVNMGRIGYIVFPSYLGGLILQWQTTPVNGAVDQLVPFPLPFPRTPLMVFVTCDYTRNSGVLNYHAAGLVDNNQFVLRSSPNSAAGGLAFSVGF